MYSPLSSIEPGAAWVTVFDPVTYALKALVPAQFVCDAAPCANVTVPAQAAAAGFADVDRYAYMAGRYGFVIEDRYVQAGADGSAGAGTSAAAYVYYTRVGAFTSPRRRAHGAADTEPSLLPTHAGGRTSATCPSSLPFSASPARSR